MLKNIILNQESIINDKEIEKNEDNNTNNKKCDLIKLRKLN